MSSKLQVLKHSLLPAPLCKAAACWVKPASSPVSLLCRVRELHRQGTLAEIAQFPSFSEGREGWAAWWNFKHSATLSQAGFHKSPDPVCTQHVRSAGGNVGPCPDLRQELGPPGNSGPGATELQHVSWLVARAESLNLTVALPPSACSLCIPLGQSDPRDRQRRTLPGDGKHAFLHRCKAAWFE